jgi:CheY-like chemotaxis protein
LQKSFRSQWSKPLSRVLVLDDEPLIAMMLSDWLGELGHEAVGPAEDAETALALCERGAIDAAILDLSLGTGNSHAVADALAAHGVPFAFATGHGNAPDGPHASVPVLGKPFDFEAVKAMVSRLTGKVT